MKASAYATLIAITGGLLLAGCSSVFTVGTYKAEGLESSYTVGKAQNVTGSTNEVSLANQQVRERNNK